MVQVKKLLEKLFEKRNNKPSESPSENLSGTNEIEIPGYLVYPNDPLSQIMFGSKMQEVCDKRCGYRFLLHTDIADHTPEIRQQTPSFDINETHIFWNPDSSAFCAVSTMKAPSVKTFDLRNWVEMNDQMGMLFGDMKPFLNLHLSLRFGSAAAHGCGTPGADFRFLLSGRIVSASQIEQQSSLLRCIQYEDGKSKQTE